ncbi:hypothetical protein [Streptomyces sp. NPDC001970]
MSTRSPCCAGVGTTWSGSGNDSYDRVGSPVSGCRNRFVSRPFADRVDEANERVPTSDARYRFVIDPSTI